MKRLPLLLTPALLLAPANADDQTRDVQAALKAQGFYYGEVTGTQGAETDAAIRRFQIRNGITVTGKLNAGTLSSLGLGEKAPGAVKPQTAQAPAPAPADSKKQVNPPPAPKPGEPILPIRKAAAPPPEIAAIDTEPKPLRRVKVNDISVVEPPVPIPSPVSTPFTTMFRDTPYADATREVQMGVIRRAQALMAGRRFYRGPIDGIAGPATSEAIFLFQDEAELRRTGRLDLDTLAEMKLLPQTARGNPVLKPFYNPNRHRDRSVSE